MGDTPVAVIEGGQIYYVRTDWIGRPVFATTSAGTVVWTASYLPFGGVRVSTGTPIDLRFPGQWFQTEAGLHQNWMRDYDPTTGRYMQADPLGLVDGASVYGYARGNPGRWIDPRGEKKFGLNGNAYNGTNLPAEVYDNNSKKTEPLPQGEWGKEGVDWDFVWIDCRCFKIGWRSAFYILPGNTHMIIGSVGGKQSAWWDGLGYQLEVDKKYCGKSDPM
jgi:RHS repeat-associated protein